MITQELLGYIRGELAKGRTREEIKGKLLSGGGWTDDDLSEAFKNIAPAQVAPTFNPIASSKLGEDKLATSMSSQPPHISIIPPLSSYTPPVITPPRMSSVPPSFTPPPTISPVARVQPISSYTPPVVSQPRISIVPPLSSPTPVINPINPNPINPINPVNPPLTPPPFTFIPGVQQPAPKAFPFGAPAYNPQPQPQAPAQSFQPAPLFQPSQLKQTILPNPPPTPPRFSFPVVKYLIIFLIVVILGVALWYFRSPITDKINSLLSSFIPK